VGVFHGFSNRLCELAMQASWRADGRYRPIKQLDLLLLGDVFDVIDSNKWLAGDIRPWQDPQTPEVAEIVSSIVDGIFRTNRDSITTLRSLATDGAIRIPVATQAGVPTSEAEFVPLTVRTFYMVGNRDWPLHLTGPQYDVIRQRVAHQIGLSSSHNAPFPHDPYESEELLSVLRRHRVFARHGDVFDPLNYTEDRDSSSLGDAIVIELINRFTATIQQEMGTDLPASVTGGLAEMNQIRPLLLIPVWLESLLERCGIRHGYRKRIKHIWDGLADEFLELDIVREQDAWSPFDLIDGLDRSLKFSKRLSIGWAGKITSWMQSLRGTDTDSYCQHALTEQDYRNRRAKHIVYGHTHVAENVPLDASYADGYVLNQVYFNTGSWGRVYRQTQWAGGEHEFIPSEAMNILSFYHSDERGGRPFEVISTVLASDALQAPVHRVDTAQSGQATEPSIPAPRLPVRAPHFQVSPATSAARPQRTR
jgi:UDP-2,3-diacylglucosamine pyrophosphatase LpxH